MEIMHWPNVSLNFSFFKVANFCLNQGFPKLKDEERCCEIQTKLYTF